MRHNNVRGRVLYAVYATAALATLLYTVGAPWETS
jgi:hypothetical protein